MSDGEIERYRSTDPRFPRTELGVDVGYDGSGQECWFWTSGSTNWVLISIDGSNNAHLAYDPPGAPAALDTTLPACTSEPETRESRLEQVWEVVARYVHERPQPSLNPAVGLTGLETHLAVSPPPPVTETLISPVTGRALDVEIRVVAVGVDWGDGHRDVFGRSLFDRLTGYPDGVARHVYEVSTCRPPGSNNRCHPELDAYPLRVAYDWFVRWRVDGESWSVLAVPDSVTTVSYPVDEIVAVIDGTG
ncbi:MAG: hypothetical protein R3246_14955 [Acidimicrobiia bacterium]|nr:hypothetical protein [Acidimicrobiia bacterium]